jgi:hypothetical protein
MLTYKDFIEKNNFYHEMMLKTEYPSPKYTILSILEEAWRSLEHDCERCGGYVLNNGMCDKCREYDKKTLEEKIPFWTNKLQEYVDKDINNA